MLKTYNKRYYLTHPWKILFEIGVEIKWAWQRVFRGWDDRATWHVSTYIFDILPPILQRLKETKHGIPIFCFEAVGAEWDGDFSDEDEKKAEEYFHLILDKMIEGFEAGYKLIQSELDIYDQFTKWQIKTYGHELEWELEKKDSEYSKAMDEFEYWKKIREEERSLELKLKKALGLFGKYYDALWD